MNDEVPMSQGLSHSPAVSRPFMPRIPTALGFACLGLSLFCLAAIVVGSGRPGSDGPFYVACVCFATIAVLSKNKPVRWLAAIIWFLGASVIAVKSAELIRLWHLKQELPLSRSGLVIPSSFNLLVSSFRRLP